MRVFVTGAAGFLGRSIVASAIDAGHHVSALVRPATDVKKLGWNPESVAVVRGDLRAPDFAEELRDIDAVVHAAAGTSGDLPSQFAGSVIATERLLGELDLSRLVRFVHVSSFSVYDFSSVRAHRLIQAGVTPIESEPERRDAYTITKLRQEALVRSTCAEFGTPLVVLRPGVIFGESNNWNWAGVGRVAGFDFVIAPRSKFRLTYVENCADAIVRAVVAESAAGCDFDIVDDDLPTHAEYRRQARLAGADISRAIPVPWPMIAMIGRTVDALNRFGLGGRAKLPEIASLRRQEARWKPFRYSNEEAKSVLGWRPEVTMRDAVARVARSTGGG